MPMADDPPNENVPEPALDKDAVEWRKGREQQHQAEETARDSGDGLDYDDDDDFEIDQAYADPHRMTLTMRLLYVILLMVIAGMVGYLVLIIIYPEQFAARDWIGAMAIKERTSQEEEPAAALMGFQLGGIHLGISPEAARRVYPSMRLEPAPYRRQTGYFLHHNGQYQVSFRNPERGGRAFRIKSEHTYPKVSYLELLTELSGKYGKPVKSGCGTEDEIIAIQCTLRWKMKDVLVEALIRTAVPEGGRDAQTLLAVTATDTRLDSAFIGLKDKKRKKKVRKKIPLLMPK